LFNPNVNIRLGTYYVKNLLDGFNNEIERTLASYNAGMGRVKQWLTGAPKYREPAEWVETIPFDQTRGYVQSVMRNADFYRRLYGDAPYEATPVAYRPPPPAAPAATASLVKGKTTVASRKTTAKTPAHRTTVSKVSAPKTAQRLRTRPTNTRAVTRASASVKPKVPPSS
jgi:hypothetical protein